MTFEELLDQAIALLQRRGRLTYGTLKRQFQLDQGRKPWRREKSSADVQDPSALPAPIRRQRRGGKNHKKTSRAGV